MLPPSLPTLHERRVCERGDLFACCDGATQWSAPNLLCLCAHSQCTQADLTARRAFCLAVWSSSDGPAAFTMNEIAPGDDTMTINPGWIWANDSALVIACLAPITTLGWYLATLAVERFCGVKPSKTADGSSNGRSEPKAELLGGAARSDDQRQRDEAEDARLKSEALAKAQAKV